MVGNIYFKQIQQILRAAEATENDIELFEAVANAPFHDKVRTTQLDLGVIVLLLVNKKTGTIDRIAYSKTEAAIGAVKMSEKPFHEIKIPIGYEGNLVAKTIELNQPHYVTDWQYLFVPGLSAAAARFNQAGAGIEFSAVHPLRARDGGALIFSYFQIPKNIKDEHHQFMARYSKLADSYLQAGQSLIRPKKQLTTDQADSVLQ